MEVYLLPDGDYAEKHIRAFSVEKLRAISFALVSPFLLLDDILNLPVIFLLFTAQDLPDGILMISSYCRALYTPERGQSTCYLLDEKCFFLEPLYLKKPSDYLYTKQEFIAQILKTNDRINSRQKEIMQEIEQLNKELKINQTILTLFEEQSSAIRQ